MNLSEKSNIISFAGGFPDPQIQKKMELDNLIKQTLDDDQRYVYGYSPTPGITELRVLISQQMQAQGRATEYEEVMITSGGISAFDLIASAVIKPQESVVVGYPGYTGIIASLKIHNINIVNVKATQNGFDLNELEDKLQELSTSNHPIKYMYCIPSFDNPTGSLTSSANRKRIIELSQKYGFVIIEDGAYQEIYYAGSVPKILASLCSDNVIHINTFSKTLSPGLRLGWVVANKEVIQALCRRKQTTDQCSSALTQYIAVTALRSGYIHNKLKESRIHYRRKRDTTIKALEDEMTDMAIWNKPEGGFYIWLKVQSERTSVEIAKLAIEKFEVAVLPGSCFYASSPRSDTLRIAFSYVDNSRIKEGISKFRMAVNC